jgi:hypothetical protein
MSAPKLSRVCSCFSLSVLVGLLAACASNSNDAATKDGKANAVEPAPKTDTAAPPSAGGGGMEGTPVEGEQKVGTTPAPEGTANEQYALKIEPGEAAVGKPGSVTIRVIPNADWHLNLEYPTKLTVTPPAGVDVPKPKLVKDDAVKFTEQDCEFAVAFTPSEAGDKVFTGEFKFAVCQDTACVPKTEKLEFNVAVK